MIVEDDEPSIDIRSILDKYDMPMHDWQYENMYRVVKEACDLTIDLCTETIKGEIVHEQTGVFTLKINLGEMHKLKDQIK